MFKGCKNCFGMAYYNLPLRKFHWLFLWFLEDGSLGVVFSSALLIENQSTCFSWTAWTVKIIWFPLRERTWCPLATCGCNIEIWANVWCITQLSLFLVPWNFQELQHMVRFSKDITFQIIHLNMLHFKQCQM